MEPTFSRLIATASRVAVAPILALLAGQAVAQQAPESAQGQDQAQKQPAWVKVCNEDAASKKILCVTTQEIRTQQGQIFASVGIRELQGTENRALIAFLPLGVKLQAGIKLQVDQNKPLDLKYDSCDQRGCYATAEMNSALLAQFKKGSKLVLQAINPQGKGFGLPLTLIGFSSALDGEGVDLRKVAAERKRLEEGLQKRAEEASQRLLQGTSGQTN